MVTLFVQNYIQKPERKTRSESRDIDENDIVQWLGETFGIFRRLAAEWRRQTFVYDVIGNVAIATSVDARGESSHRKRRVLKLYCRYLYTRPCMINHIWGLKQLWLQVNGHAWFHLQRLRWPVRNGEGAKNSKWKYMSPAGFEPTPRQSTVQESCGALDRSTTRAWWWSVVKCLAG